MFPFLLYKIPFRSNYYDFIDIFVVFLLQFTISLVLYIKIGTIKTIVILKYWFSMSYECFEL